MVDLKFTNKAKEDLNSIWFYTLNTWSEKQADDYYNMLIATCKRLAAGSFVVTRQYPEIAPDLFGAYAGKHIIFFRPFNGYGILIVRILHSRMDIKAKLR